VDRPATTSTIFIDTQGGTMEPNRITLANFRTVHGAAGATYISVDVSYPAEEPIKVEFRGSVYGGPTYVSWNGQDMLRVDSPERFGDRLDEVWVRAYYA
jgi:hypothetical protein